MAYITAPVIYQIGEAQHIINNMVNKGADFDNHATITIATANGMSVTKIPWSDSWKMTAHGFAPPADMIRTIPRAITKVGWDESPVETQYDSVDCLLAFFGSTVEDFWNADMDSALRDAYDTFFLHDDEQQKLSVPDGVMRVPLF